MIFKIFFSSLEILKKAKLDLQNKSIPELIQLARHIIACMTGNANFTTPKPTLLAIETATNEVETTYQESQSGDKIKKAALKTLVLYLKHQLSLLSIYVTSAAAGDEIIILSSGMEVNKVREHIGSLAAPADVRLSKGTNEGEVTVRCNKVEHASSYLFEYYESIPQQNPQTGGETVAGITLGMRLADIPWQGSEPSTSTTFMITDLIPGNRILVRVAALGSDGLGTWSDPATMIVP